VDSNQSNYIQHIIRSSFRDWSGEISSFPLDMAEMALAHNQQKQRGGRISARGLFAKRRKMMQE